MSYRSIASNFLSLLVIIASNPILLTIAVIIGVAFIILGVGFIVYYNLATAIILLVITGGSILFMDALHIVKIKDYPFVIAIPFICALIGYGGQNVKYSVNGQETALIDASVAINPNATNPSAYILLYILIIILAIVGVAALIKKMRQK